MYQELSKKCKEIFMDIFFAVFLFQIDYQCYNHCISDLWSSSVDSTELKLFNKYNETYSIYSKNILHIF